jgi:hypothetical protein
MHLSGKPELILDLSTFTYSDDLLILCIHLQSETESIPVLFEVKTSFATRFDQPAGNGSVVHAATVLSQLRAPSLHCLTAINQLLLLCNLLATMYTCLTTVLLQHCGGLSRHHSCWWVKTCQVEDSNWRCLRNCIIGTLALRGPAMNRRYCTPSTTQHNKLCWACPSKRPAHRHLLPMYLQGMCILLKPVPWPSC